MTLLRDYYNKLENIKGTRLISLLVLVFVIFLTLGISIGYLNNLRLKAAELNKLDSSKTETNPRLKEYAGKVVYVNPLTYPDEKISFVLLDDSGKELVLLRSKDQKDQRLASVEGLRATIKGLINKTKDGKKEVLEVLEVTIKNGSN